MHTIARLIVCAGLVWVGWESHKEIYPSYTLLLKDHAVMRNAEFVPWDGSFARISGSDVHVENVIIPGIRQLHSSSSHSPIVVQ